MKKKLLLLLTITTLTGALVACGDDNKTTNANNENKENTTEETTSEDNDIITQIETLDITIDGFVVEFGWADGKDVTYKGNLTDYTIVSENSDLISVEGFVTNKGLITKEPVIIDFNINQDGIIDSWITNPDLPEIEPTLPLTADMILDMELIGEIAHQEGDKISVSENGDWISNWYTEEIPINRDTVTSVRFAEPEDYDFYDKALDGSLTYYGDIILYLTDGRQFYASISLDYYHDYDDNYEKSNDEPKWIYEDTEIGLRNLRKEDK